jgi:ABC-type antimicrobial peptide transport system permease subunit
VKDNKFRNEITRVMRDNTMFVYDIKKFEESLELTMLMLQLFFFVIGLVAFFLSFFLLLISITSNINENIWEFGVLRAIGVKKSQIMRIYLYESLTVVLSAGILGLLIGFFLAVVITIQFNLFLELPFKIIFPFELTSSMYVLAITTTVLGTAIPIADVNKRQIADILRSAS